MSIFSDAVTAIKSMAMTRSDIDRLDRELDVLRASHTDTRERVMRIEGLIEGARMQSRLPRR